MLTECTEQMNGFVTVPLVFLEALKAENNHVTRLWSGAGLPVYTAADSQALLQLQKEYCDRKDCLRCRFGYEYLRGKK